MRRFTFPMDSVLAIRNERERQALELLAQRVADLQVARHRQQALKAQLDGAQLPADSRLFLSHQLFVECLEAELRMATAEVAGAEERAAQARALAAKASAEREVLERLRDRRRAEWEGEAQRQETLELDEMGLRKAVQS